MTDKGGKAFISLRFQDGDYKESGNIIISCNKNEFKNLLESFVVENRKHIVIGSVNAGLEVLNTAEIIVLSPINIYAHP
jgi:hypothetical protein